VAGGTATWVEVAFKMDEKVGIYKYYFPPALSISLSGNTPTQNPFASGAQTVTLKVYQTG
jgi:hypothetical protein